MPTKKDNGTTLRHLSLDGIKNQYNLEAEISLLSAMMLDAEIAQIAITRLRAEDFYDNRHYYIFDAIAELAIEAQQITLPAILDKLEHKTTKGKKPQKYIDVVGGYEYLYEVYGTMPSAAGYEQYIEIIKKYSVLRSLLKAAFEIAAKASESDDAAEALNFAERTIFEIAQTESSGDMQLATGLLETVLNKINEIHSRKSNIGGIKTGFKRLDKLLNGGFHESDLVLVAARPACGKTSFAMNIATNMALNDKSVAVFSLEMPYEQLMIRMLFSIANQDISQGLSGTMTDEGLSRVMQAGKKLIGKKLYINDSTMTNPADILSKCRRLKSEKGLDCIVVDYLQLMHLEKAKENRQQEVSEMSRLMKLAAKELRIPIILLSQMSRAVESRENMRQGLKPKPQLSDLRESGAIEQDADIVMFLYTQQAVDTESPIRPVNLMIAKHRNGQIGEIPLIFKSSQVTFVESEGGDTITASPAAPKEAETAAATPSFQERADAFAAGNNGETPVAPTIPPTVAPADERPWEDNPSAYSGLAEQLSKNAVSDPGADDGDFFDDPFSDGGDNGDVNF